MLTALFRKVTYTCHHCGARQRIPLRRIHRFERFHSLEDGQPVLIACTHCPEGVQIPSPYRTHTRHDVTVDPESPPSDAFLHIGI